MTFKQWLESDAAHRIMTRARMIQVLDILVHNYFKFPADSNDINIIENSSDFVPIEDVKMDLHLSVEAIQLAHIYMKYVDAQTSGNVSNGLQAEELERSRTLHHNRFIKELNRCGVYTKDRAATTRLAIQIVGWLE